MATCALRASYNYQDVFDGLSHRFRRAFRDVSIQQYRKSYVASSLFEATLCAVTRATMLAPCATKRVNLDHVERLG
ncbi:MAG: hypothetical protein QOG55_2197 [Acidobacteriaceae bacterium]|jgi:hypothetical protein|nr:hypothetical protein [Acidobacteriaceae bacterium]